MVAFERDDWEQHWDHFAESAERNPAQLYRRHLIFNHVSDGPTRILDIGSGQGDLAAECLARFPDAEVTGVEFSGSGIRVAESKVQNAVFLHRDLLEPGEPPPGYASWATHAFCSEVLEHVDDPVRLLRHSRAYLQPGCLLVVTVPGGPMSAFDRHIGHRRHFRRAELRGVLEEAGFAVETISAAGFPFFNLYRMLVILRGRKLIDDAASEGLMAQSSAVRLVMGAFRALFRLNLPATPWGWQMVASARVPRGTSSAT